jgi:hypothetical protein
MWTQIVGKICLALNGPERFGFWIEAGLDDAEQAVVDAPLKSAEIAGD